MWMLSLYLHVNQKSNYDDDYDMNLQDLQNYIYSYFLCPEIEIDIILRISRIIYIDISFVLK